MSESETGATVALGAESSPLQTWRKMLSTTAGWILWLFSTRSTTVPSLYALNTKYTTFFPISFPSWPLFASESTKASRFGCLNIPIT